MCPQLILEPWHWLVFGSALVALEILVPKVFLMWVGGAAIAVSGIFYLKPDLSVSNLILLFFLLSLAASGIAAQLGYISKLRHRKKDDLIVGDSILAPITVPASLEEAKPEKSKKSSPATKKAVKPKSAQSKGAGTDKKAKAKPEASVKKKTSKPAAKAKSGPKRKA
jgi:hypothetical protein